MKYLMLTVLLAMAQAPPPITQKATDSAASMGKKVQTKANNNQTPTAPTQSSINPTTAPSHDVPGKELRADDAQNPVIIGKLPTVTIETHRDWIDWGIWIFNGFLVFVG